MPNNSLLLPIMNGVAAVVTNLGLTWSGAAIPVAVKKTPARHARFDPRVQVVVCKGRPPAVKGSFTNTLVSYFIDVVLVAPNRDDQVSNIDDGQAYSEMVRQALLKQPALGVPQVWGVRASHGANYDPKQIANGYETNVVSVRVDTAEAPAHV